MKTGAIEVVEDRAVKRVLGSEIWRHYYRCSCCHDDWTHLYAAPQALGSCPLCARKTLPYESEICVVSGG